MMFLNVEPETKCPEGKWGGVATGLVPPTPRYQSQNTHVSRSLLSFSHLRFWFFGKGIKERQFIVLELCFDGDIHPSDLIVVLAPRLGRELKSTRYY